MTLDDIEIHTIGGLLKNYFRDTKEPIFPFCYYETLLDVGMNLTNTFKNEPLRFFNSDRRRINVNKYK
jgi:hypothetical protein